MRFKFHNLIAKISITALLCSLLPLQAFAQGVPLFTDLSDSAPRLDNVLTIFGENINLLDQEVVLYPLADGPNEANLHRPIIDDWASTYVTFRLGAVESGPDLQEGVAYTANLWSFGEILTEGINFTIGNGDVAMCEDDDESDDIYTRGTATYDDQQQVDTCSDDGESVIQVYCDGTTIIGQRDAITCQYGCLDGICRTDPVETPVPACTDSDQEDNAYVRGEAKYQDQTLYDYCGEDDKTLYQVRCDSDTKIGESTVICEGGCSNGSCLPTDKTTPTSSCTDTDTKEDIYVKGIVKADGKTETDVCDGDDLFQVACKDGKTNFLDGKKCENGCNNGACVKKETIVEETNDDTDDQSTDEDTNPESEEEDLSKSPNVISEDDVTKVFSRLETEIFEKPIVREFDELAGLSKDAKFRLGLSTFKDVDGEWFDRPVRRLSSLGIVSGFKDGEGNPTGEYGPGNNVVLGAVLKIAFQSAGIETADEVTGQPWHKPYIDKAKELDLCFFNQPNVDPVRPATRGEVACIITEAFEFQKGPLSQNYSDISGDHKFAQDFAPLLNLGVFKGDDNASTLRPDDGINRAEVAAVFGRAIDVDLSSATICPLANDAANIMIMGVETELVRELDGSAKIANNAYQVRVKPQLLLTNGQPVSGIRVRLFRHDLTPLGSGKYQEVIKEIKVPASWFSTKLEAGRYRDLSAVVQVPKTTYLAYKAYSGSVYDSARFTVVVDLGENNLAEIIDVADNIRTFDARLNVSGNSAVADDIPQREIWIGDTKKTTNKSNLEFDVYSKHKLLAHAPYETALGSFYNRTGTNIGRTTKGCMNLKAIPGSLKINELSSKDGEVRVQIEGQFEKTSNIPLATHTWQAETVLYMTERGTSNTIELGRWRPSHAGFSQKLGKGTNEKVTISTTVNLKNPPKDVEFFMMIDADDDLKEINENDNGVGAIHQFTSNQFTACAFDKNKEVDIWVMGVTGDPVKENGQLKKSGKTYFLNLEAHVQVFMQDAKDVNLHLFQHKTSKDSSGGIIETIQEINVPNSWKGLDLTAGRIEIMKAEIPVDEDDLIFLGQNEVVGAYFTVVADLPEDSVAETEEVNNNIGTGFIPVESALQAAGRFEMDGLKFYTRNIKETSSAQYENTTFKNTIPSDVEFPTYRTDKIIKRQYDETAYAAAFQRHYTGNHQIKNQGAIQHQRCTNLELDNITVTQQPGTTDRAIKTDVKIELSKTGALPLPKDFVVAQFYYRPAQTNKPFRIAQTWTASDLKEKKPVKPGSTETVLDPLGDDGATLGNSLIFGGVNFESNTGSLLITEPKTEYVLNGEVTVKAYDTESSYNDYDFRVLIDPNNVIGEKNEKDNEDVQMHRTSLNKSVDLEIDFPSMKMSNIYKDGNGNLKADFSYSILNKGTSDVESDFSVRLSAKEDPNFGDTWLVPEVKNGKYTGKRTISIPDYYQSEYNLFFEVDVNKELLDANRNSNINSTGVPWDPILKNDMSVDIEVLTDPSISLSVIPETDYTGKKLDEFYSLLVDYPIKNNDKDWAYFKNGQKFPSTFDKKEETVNLPGLILKKSLQTKTFRYVEHVLHSGNQVGLHVGAVRVKCASKCKDNAFKSGSVGFGREGKNGVKLIEEYYGPGKVPGKNSAQVYDWQSTRTYWPNTWNAQTKEHLHEYGNEQPLYVAKDDGTYIVYSYLKRHWFSSWVHSQSNEDWGHLLPSFVPYRHFDRPYTDGYNDNNYQIIELEIKNGKVNNWRKISAAAAAAMTKSVSSSDLPAEYSQMINTYAGN